MSNRTHATHRVLPRCQADFFVLEMMNGSVRQKQSTWCEVFRDTSDNSSQQPALGVLILGLQAGCNYRFRIQAFNQQGPSPYSAGTFATPPPTPPTPVLMSSAPQKLVFSWRSQAEVQERKEMTRLHNIFKALGGGQAGELVPIGPDSDLRAALEANDNIKRFLQASPCSKASVRELGVAAGVGDKAGSVWWCLTNAFAPEIDWVQFENLFRNKKRITSKVRYYLQRCSKVDSERAHLCSQT